MEGKRERKTVGKEGKRVNKKRKEMSNADQRGRRLVNKQGKRVNKKKEMSMKIKEEGDW